MSIEMAEQLKREWTDKYVIVDESIPQLKRFVGLTGRVKTVNMNCLALVEFDAPEDISWYDISPTQLKVVDKPLPKKKAAPPEKPAAKPAASKSPAAGKPGGKGLSPLELARQQGGSKTAGANQPAESKAATTPASAKKLSPLELARQQDAAKKAAAAQSGQEESTKEEPSTESKPEATTGSSTAPGSGKKLSPLELARQQDKRKS